MTFFFLGGSFQNVLEHLQAPQFNPGLHLCRWNFKRLHKLPAKCVPQFTDPSIRERCGHSAETILENHSLLSLRGSQIYALPVHIILLSPSTHRSLCPHLYEPTFKILLQTGRPGLVFPSGWILDPDS